MMRLPVLCLHALLVLASAAAGDVSPRSLAPIKDSDWDRAKAAHLLRRAGFGGTPEQVEYFATIGPQKSVDMLLNYDEIPYQPAPPLFPDELYKEPDRAAMRDMTPDERRKAADQRRKQERDAFEETRLWWIERMVQSPRPLEEMMTLYWHGHFTSGMREVRNPIYMREQNEFFRSHALGNFRDIVQGISRDRAMLVYLDGNKNNKQQPNENYARELMELFTLGVGNYTEDDVRAAARAFTGWTFTREGFTFKAGSHDFGEKTFLKKTGRFNGDDVIDIILKQPAASRFLAKNLLEFFVRPDPDKQLIESLSGVIRQNKYEMKPVMRTLLLSQAFYSDASRGTLVKSPVEIVVGTARALGTPVANLRLAERAMVGMGQELMQPPNVKGWDGGQAWINTATLFNRYNTVTGMVWGSGKPSRDPFAEEAESNDEVSPMGMTSMTGMSMMMGDAPAARSRMTGEPQPAFDPMPWVQKYKLTTAEEIVDFFVDHLIAAPLSTAKRTMLVEYLQGEDAKFKISERRADDRIRMMIALLCSTPEFQLY